MYVPFSWLKEFVDLDCDVNDFADKMTMTGTKVETIKKVGEKISSVITGKILEIKQHPEADRLVVTKVDIGNNKVLQIITAAKNIFVGATVPVAVHNSVLADGTKIKKSKLRGVLSEGMFCSIEELGFTKNQYPEAPDDGIYIFQKDQEDIGLGLDVRPLLELTEEIIDFEITSNRPDCLSILGIAREAAATFDKKIKDYLKESDDLLDKNAGSRYRIDIQNQNLCRRYMLQEIDDVIIEPSPLWLRHRLISCGINPVNNVVDITNYVMLELGQPLHAFDAEKIDGDKITVREANSGEVLNTLDGTERNLEDKMLVIADDKKILALAGIMGGESSKINNTTKRILIESANFDAYNIRQTSKKLKLHTDSSMRFEKNIDINLTELAMRRAIYLIKKLCHGKITKKTLDFYPIKKQEREIKLNPQKINKLLGTDISTQDMISILNKLDFQVDNLMIKIPTFRDDIECDADIAEEILRFYGYDKVDCSLPSTATMGKKDEFQIMCDKIKNMISTSGGYEIKGFSFESPKVFDKCLIHTERECAIKILNPLGEEFSILRTNMINNMLNALTVNLNKQNTDAILFEIGKVFQKKDLINEYSMLTIGAYGSNDFFVIKGLIEKLFCLFKIKDYSFKKAGKSFLHPYRCTEIFIKDESIGFLGELHPKVKENCDIKTKVYLASIDLKSLYKKTNHEVKFKPLAKFPAVYRDLCVIVDKKIFSQDLINTMRSCEKNILEDIKLFDIYDGEQIQDDKKSMTYRLIFRSEAKTLEEEEISPVLNKIVDALKKEFNAVLRE